MTSQRRSCRPDTTQIDTPNPSDVGDGPRTDANSNGFPTTIFTTKAPKTIHLAGGKAMKIAPLPMRVFLLLAATLPFSSPSFAQANIEAMKDRCDAYGFVRGTSQHADCVRKLDLQLTQIRCQALIERGKQVCSQEYANVIGAAAMAADCGTVRDEFQQYCQ